MKMGTLQSKWRAFLLLVLGLVIGLGLGLYLGWVAWPTEFTDANPAVLQTDYRQDYVRLVADAYAADGDLVGAQRRVNGLGPEGQQLVLDVTLDAILAGEEETAVRRLVHLATDLGLSSPAMAPYLEEAQ